MGITSGAEIAAIIRETRKAQGITQEEMADFAGLQRTGIVRIESGKTDLRVSTLLKICQILGLKLNIGGGEEGE